MLTFLAAVLLGSLVQDPPRPIAAEDGLTVELVAQEPEIANPTGIAVDARGRIWAIENNTHMRTKDYPGPETDRLRVFSDFGPDGRARKSETIADGFTLGMNLAFGLKGQVYLITRNSIEEIAYPRRPLVRLETVGDYHHNGLFGMAVDHRGDLYFAIGRNTGKDFPVGAPWTLVGSDGSKISGSEGGRIFRCHADGSELTPLASGFWNTFHMTFDAFGRLFAVDNDPGGGSECRLLHIVPGGDYGFRPRAGYRDGHPFHSWTGEHAGTLPIVSFTGEAPAGILSCESELWPDAYWGTLLVTSWSDHQVERYHLVPRGASFTARREPVLRGGENFRPVGIVMAPDGSLVLSDWVDRSYPVHGKGRIWRVRPKGPPSERSKAGAALQNRIRAVRAGTDAGLDDPAEEVRGEAVRRLADDDPRRLQIAAKDASNFVRLQALVGMKPPSTPPELFFALLEDPDPFLVGATISLLGRPGASDELSKRTGAPSAKIRVGLLAALKRTGDKVDPAVIRRFLGDSDPLIRREAIQWAAEDGLAPLLLDIAAAAAREPVTIDIFNAYLGALEFLTAPSGRRDAKSAQTHLAGILSNPNQSASMRAYALRKLPPEHPLLALTKLQEWATGGDEALRLEAVRSLSTSILEPAQETLRTIVQDRQTSLLLRLDATAGLAQSAASSLPTRRLLLALLDDANEEVRFEAVRSVGGAAADPEVRGALRRLLEQSKDRPDLAEKIGLVLKLSGDALQVPQPGSLEEWKAAGREAGDPSAGERIFFHPRGPQCFACHRVRGRGGEVGPDLSRLSRGLERDPLIDSILEPSRDIAPDFAAWEIITRDGDSWVGRILKEETKDLTLLGPSNRPVSIPRGDIAIRRPSRVSMMPDGLQRGLTRKEFRDLVAFLGSLR
ncbi:MAG TPA: PVC-type heme-binding CxxCH protein [Planctomycetota bacterium]|nr:PVC-type heme-binding CxxCH protein [Planctomycetota bacterium]